MKHGLIVVTMAFFAMCQLAHIAPSDVITHAMHTVYTLMHMYLR